MAAESQSPNPRSDAADRVQRILTAAEGWARDYPPALDSPIRAVAVRLAEMVADQRNYLAPLPEPQESERSAMLQAIVALLRSPEVAGPLASELSALDELELRSTGSWSTVDVPHHQWIETAVRFLEGAGGGLPASDQPEPYWADDVVAGIIAFARATVGVDELQARTEARYSGGVPRPPLPPEDA